MLTLVFALLMASACMAVRVRGPAGDQIGVAMACVTRARILAVRLGPPYTKHPRG